MYFGDELISASKIREYEISGKDFLGILYHQLYCQTFKDRLFLNYE